MTIQLILNQETAIAAISYLSVLQYRRQQQLNEYTTEGGTDQDYADSLRQNIKELDACIEELRDSMQDAVALGVAQMVDSFKH